MPPVIPASATLLVELADCVCTTVAEEGVGPLCHCALWPGGVPTHDHCGECDDGSCGVGYVSVVSIEPYTTFGSLNPQATCTTMLQAVVNVGVVRCLPVVEDGLPHPDDLAETALAMHVDAYAMRKAISCCTADTILRGYRAIPAQGGCAGGEWQAVIDLG